MYVAATRLMWCRRERVLKLSNRLVREPEINKSHTLMPGKLALINPPRPFRIAGSYAVLVVGVRLSKECERSLVTTLCHARALRTRKMSFLWMRFPQSFLESPSCSLNARTLRR